MEGLGRDWKWTRGDGVNETYTWRMPQAHCQKKLGSITLTAAEAASFSKVSG